MNQPFPSLVICKVNYIRWDALEAIPEIDFSNFLFGTGDKRVATYEEALEIVFRQMNRVDGTEYISRANLKVPSLSVGDTVSIRSSQGRRYFVCEGTGWAEISYEDRNWLIDLVTHRDFWGTFAKTVEKSVEKSNAINS
jgi:hypothetical protein